MQLKLLLAFLFPITLIFAESIEYRMGNRTYPASPGGLSNPATPYIQAKNREIQEQLDQALRHGLRNFGSLSVSLPALNQSSPLMGQVQWLETYTKQLASINPSIQAALKPQMKALTDRDPVALVESLDGYFSGYSALNRVDPDTALALKKAALSGFLDKDGLIYGLPDVQGPVQLISSWDSESGLRIRHGLNRLMVSKQIFEGEYRLRCGDGSTAGCEKLAASMSTFRTQYEELSLAYAVADRLSLNVTLAPAVNELLNILGQKVETYFQFAKGVWLGARDGVGSFIEGSLSLIADPVGTLKSAAVGIGNALVEWRKTRELISNAIGTSIASYLYGTSEERGKIAGRLAFEIAAVVLPLGKASEVKLLAEAQVFKNSVEKAAVAFGVRATAQELLESGKISVAVRDSAVNLSKALPETTAEILRAPPKSPLVTSALPNDKVLAIGKSDLLVRDLVRVAPAETIEFLTAHGPEATAGIARFKDPRLFSLWKDHSKEFALLGREISKTIEIVPGTPEFISLRNLHDYSLELARGGRFLSQNAQEYFIRQAAYSSVVREIMSRKFITVQEFKALNETFERLDPLIRLAPRQEMEIYVTRGILKEYTDELGHLVKTNPDSIFEIGIYNTVKNHRYSQPGERALYTVVGKTPDVISTIELELGTGRASLYIGTKRVKVAKVLNLQDPNTLRMLEIDSSFLIREGEDKYSITHQLGFLAKKHGFDGIQAPSAKDPTGSNLIIFLGQ